MNKLKVNNTSLISPPSNGDVGYDIFANSEPNIVGRHVESVGYTHIDYIEYDSGLIIDPSSGYHTLLFPRSSISNKKLVLCNSVGVIDSSYRGTIKIRFKYIPSPEDIINMKKMGKKRWFLIKWTGYDDPSWEPEELLRESKDFEEHLEIYLDEIVNGTKVVLRQSKGRNMKARPK